jgi:hypothetical protein
LKNEAENLIAIQTRYKGYRFRSRLEARWAVFFDAVSLDWNYEHEGFNLDSGPYLPDFLIKAGAGCYVEIKPNVSVTRANRLCSELSRVTNTCVLLIQGDPWPGLYWAILFHEGIGYNNVKFGQGPLKPSQSEIWLVSNELSHCLNLRNPDDEVWPIDELESPALAHAFKVARGARFEHGESPETAKQQQGPATP